MTADPHAASIGETESGRRFWAYSAQTAASDKATVVTANSLEHGVSAVHPDVRNALNVHSSSAAAIACHEYQPSQHALHNLTKPGIRSETDSKMQSHSSSLTCHSPQVPES